MKGEEIFKYIVSGRMDNLVGRTLCKGLAYLSKGYEAAVDHRNSKFDAGVGVYQSTLPVISVGNITLGGTGKTPMVRYICEYLQNNGQRPTVVTRGYKAANNKDNQYISRQGRILVEPDISGDEAFLLAKSLPNTSVIIGRNRSLSAQMAEADAETDVLVMDDGFQHRALGRCADIVLIDAANPFGYGFVLPRGFLREPLSGLQRATAIVLTKVDQVESGQLQEVVKVLQNLCPNRLLAQTTHQPKSLFALEDWIQGRNPQAPEAACQQKILAVSGIGNPKSFCMTLEDLGYSVVGLLGYSDHHNFTTDDLIRIWKEAFATGAQAICVTEKDAVKLSQLSAIQDMNIPIYVLTIGIHFVSGEKELQEHINERIDSVV